MFINLGGIINYLKKQKNKNKMWEGECFVFDERVTINDRLEKEVTLSVLLAGHL